VIRAAPEPSRLLWVALAAIAALGVLVLALGATLPGGLIFAGAAVAGWWVLTVRGLRSLRQV